MSVVVSEGMFYRRVVEEGRKGLASQQQFQKDSSQKRGQTEEGKIVGHCFRRNHLQVGWYIEDRVGLFGIREDKK